ncbi:MAG: NADP-dependent phosphogluconate dehydrogenase, partial [Alphaproteobacteria bacterium]|nr:NADP-dependent phosphogluconate dehydrogenase [Alphaproteobacteria bacterium]
MGRNLALNFRDKNIRVAVFDTFAEVRSNFPKQAGTQDIPVCSDFANLVSRLAAPRIVLLMVKAGEPVDAAIATLARHLTEGDIIVDGGNSFWQDTERRETELAAKGIRFVGAGISGGEEGARHGPSIMVGGAKEAWASLQPLLQAIAAKSGSIACCDWVGPGGAGHFVKMMHNGVEYAVMQMLGEAWILMRDAAGLSPVKAAKEFSRWNDGPMGSFLIEITAEILSHTDDLTGRPLIEMIADNAGQKGTGGWSVTAALDLGVSAPSIAEAVMTRALSGAKGDRALAQQALSQHHASGSNVNLALDDLEQAYGAAAIVAYAQGF